jgi:hypothetical protein
MAVPFHSAPDVRASVTGRPIFRPRHTRPSAGSFHLCRIFPMVDFKNETRKRCRHCKMRLPEPTSNERQAFCTRGCYGSFYLHRCRVCEAALSKAKGRPRVICKKAKCRNAWNAGEGFGKYATANFSSQVSKNPEKSSKNAMDVGPFGASGTVETVRSTVALSRPWRVVAAGSPISANAYHCAVVSDALDGGLPDIPMPRFGLTVIGKAPRTGTRNYWRSTLRD